MSNSEKTNQSLDDESVLDAYEEQIQIQYAPKKSGKGGKKKRRSQDFIDHILAIETANRRKNESLDPIARIDEVIGTLLLHDEAVNRKHFQVNLRLWLDPEDRKPGLLPHLSKYLQWLEETLVKQTPLFTSNQLKETFAHSGGPGGQNVNKTNSAVDLLHLPSLLQVHSEATRDQSKNRQLAQELLQEKLQDHLNDWRIFIDSYSPATAADLNLIVSGKIEDQVRAVYSKIKPS